MHLIYLLGYPLAHSISPEMQNAALRARGFSDVRYEKFSLPPEHIDEMIAKLREPNCLGANVTVPHKQTILAELDEITDLARDIGAVNTILKREDKLIGDNTDAYGFTHALRARGVELQNIRAAILGAGGAAAAAAYALAEAGVREIILLNRTLMRSIELADRLHPRFPQMELAINDWNALPRMGLIVNATSVGMTPRVEDSPLPRNARLSPGTVVFDLVYNPPVTKFLRAAEQCGAQTIGGLDMLIYQGARAFELWTSQAAPVDVMRQAAQRALEDILQHQ